MDKSRHPRFAIGESTTPLADQCLLRIAHKYDLPWLIPLTSYGQASQISEQVTVGLKRGFSYFFHKPFAGFAPTHDRENELLVAASSKDYVSDTNWLRSTVDHYISKHLAKENIDLFEEVEVIFKTANGTLNDKANEFLWKVSIRQSETEFRDIECRFVIDATGSPSKVPSESESDDAEISKLSTNTRAVFGHFENLTPWYDVYSDLGGETNSHPFRCDAAAVHQIIEEGWMWQLRFDNQVTSAGIVFQNSIETSGSAEEQWNQILQKYPSLARQFENAKLIAPESLVSTGQIQRLRKSVVIGNRICLPNSAGFIDPLHSTGIAHTLSGVERLAEIFSNQSKSNNHDFANQLAEYDRQIRNEILWIDKLVSVCYAAHSDFSLFRAATMLYFAASIFAERNPNSSHGFLGCQNHELQSMVDSVRQEICEYQVRDPDNDAGDSISRRVEFIRQKIKPFNDVGLMEPGSKNLYQHTAAPKKSV